MITLDLEVIALTKLSGGGVRVEFLRDTNLPAKTSGTPCENIHLTLYEGDAQDLRLGQRIKLIQAGY